MTVAVNENRFRHIAADLAGDKQPVDEPKFETRQDAARRACEEAGIVWPATILPPGTALYTSGVDTLKSDRARWAKLPDASTGVRVISAALAAEDRKDVQVKVSELKLLSTNARLVSSEKAVSPQMGAGYDAHAFRQLVAQIPNCGPGEAPRGFATSLLHLDNDELAAVLNRRLPAATTTVTLRTKMAHSGGRIVRAVLSEKYGDLNDIHVGQALEAVLGDDAREAKLDYKPGDKRSKFEVIFPSHIPVKTFVVGDVHYMGISIENSETGEGSCNVRAFLMRAACANLTLAPGEGVTLRHVGKTERLVGQMRAAVKAAVEQLDPLIALIQQSAGERLTDFTAKTPGDIIRALAKKYEIADDRAKTWADTYATKYGESPTTWGITSAITEAAQGASVWTETAEEEHIAADVMAVGVRKALGF